MDNGYELDAFQPILDRLIRNFESKGETWDFSLLFEWLSPTNVIVINYGDKPQFRLIGQVNHADYSLGSQKSLDFLADVIGVDRPETFSFGSIKDLLAQVDNWKGREGVCIYSKGGQEIHKVKASKYLFCHRMKSEVSSLENVLDVWLSQGKPSYIDFYNYIVNTFDYEIAEMARENISTICDSYKEVLKIVAYMKEFVTPLKNIPRKDAALKIISSYGNTNRSGFLFKFLDSKELSDDDVKKLIFQVTKNN